MRAMPFIFISILAVLQALLAIYWMTAGAARQFTQVQDAFHGTLPPWSALAFSLGWNWLALPLAGLAWLLLAWRKKANRRNAWLLALASLLVLLAMVYAMYPLHLVFAGR